MLVPAETVTFNIVSVVISCHKTVSVKGYIVEIKINRTVRIKIRKMQFHLLVRSVIIASIFIKITARYIS